MKPGRYRAQHGDHSLEEISVHTVGNGLIAYSTDYDSAVKMVPVDAFLTYASLDEDAVYRGNGHGPMIKLPQSEVDIYRANYAMSCPYSWPAKYGRDILNPISEHIDTKNTTEAFEISETSEDAEKRHPGRPKSTKE